MLSTYQQLGFLANESGLTRSQIARLLNVFPRTVFNILYLGMDTSYLEKRIERVYDVVSAIEGDADHRRSVLLDSSKGDSLFRSLTKEATWNKQIQYVVPLKDRL